MHNKVLVICGPTASGKSSLALNLARRLSVNDKSDELKANSNFIEIVSADSMQIYRGFDIGTAKVSQQEQQEIKHHLIDICEPDQFFSVAHYKKLAVKAIREILSRGNQPVVCGGTGQYLSSLVEGIEYIDMPVDDMLRQKLNQQADQFGAEQMLAQLAQIDPQTAARLTASDRKRIIRAHEIIALTGMTPTQVNEKSKEKGPDFNYISFCLLHDRDILYQKINTRVLEMINGGWIEETRQLLEHGLPENATALQAIGYRQIIEYLHGVKNKDQIISEIQQATRRYAKRQLTWFRKMKDLIWLDASNPDQCLETIVSTLSEQHNK